MTIVQISAWRPSAAVPVAGDPPGSTLIVARRLFAAAAPDRRT
jgi:hypothetical protein